MQRPRLLAFLAVALASLACGPSSIEDGVTSAGLEVNVRPALAEEGTRVRIVAANLTAGNGQSYDTGEGARILQGVGSDVVLIQELNVGDGSAASIRGFVDRTFGPTFSYVRDPSGQIPNGVISRFPILASGSWRDPQTSTRSFAWARIDVPGDRDLWAVSVHLLTSSSSARQAEASTIVSQIRATVPESDLLVVGGDLNTGSRTESCIRTLGGVVDVLGPFPVDASGNGNTNASRSKPYDWVLADRDLEALEVPVLVGGATFTSGLVFDSRVFQPVSEVPPVLPGDSAASNMQHMAVVRDFVLPAIAPE